MCSLREDGINASIVLYPIFAVRRRSSHLDGRACDKDNDKRSGKGLPVCVAVCHKTAHNVLAYADQGQQGFDPLWDQSNVPGNHHYQ